MKTFLMIFLELLFVQKINAQQGIIDSSFGTNGIGAFPFSNGVAYSVVIQQDGKIIIGGHIPNKFALARFKSNGTLDSTYGTNGLVTTTVGVAIDAGGYLAIQTDGKVLITGGCIEGSGKRSCALARFKTDGTLDNTFSGDGKLITEFNSSGYDDISFCVAEQPDGKIIQAGTGVSDAGIMGFAAVRYNSNGTIDNSFGTNGKTLFQIGNQQPWAYSIIIQPDGKILLGGTSWSYPSIIPSCFVIARLNANGILDNSFGSGGKVTTYFGAGGSSGSSYDDDEGNAMALQSDGKILMTGTSYLGSDNKTSIPIVRYNTDGSLDNSFGLNGKVRLTIDSLILGSSCLVLQVDGKILCAGSSGLDTGGVSIGSITLVRFNSNGTLDSSFGVNGIAISAFDSTGASSIAIQQDNKIVCVGGYSNKGMMVARFLPGLVLGVLDLSVSDNPILIYPNPIQSQATIQYTLTKEENISVTLYDIQGKLVQEFFTNETRATGKHEEVLHLNELLPAGTYIINISNGKNSQGVKIIKE